MKKKRILLCLVLLLLPILAELADFSNRELSQENEIMIGSYGERAKEIDLQLQVQGESENYDYLLRVEGATLTDMQKAELFDKARAEIDDSFFEEGQDSNHVEGRVYPHTLYANGLVEAEWFFDNYHVLDVDGIVQQEAFADQNQEDGKLVYVEAELTCAESVESYGFYIQAYPTPRTQREEFLGTVEQIIHERATNPGATTLILPEEVEGKTLLWREKLPHTGVKVAFLELALLLFFPFVRMERRKKVVKEREQSLLFEYPNMVSKLTILVSCGMPVKQAWNKISAQYFDKRSKVAKPTYEEMLITTRELESGESEKNAYRNFGERTKLQPYHRLTRILIQNLEKGTAGLSEQLGRESEGAFEERKRIARKLGEEAQTKMIAPLILMMGIVMAIVIAPAIIEFRG